MFAGWSAEAQTPEQTQIELMAHGGSTIEIQKTERGLDGGRGQPVRRRITLATEIEIVGPVAGHERLKTNADPTGTKVLGTLNNCAGGKTPWGTVLMAEENFHQYFGGELPADSPEAANYKRYGVTGEAEYPWHRSVDRFDLAKEPNEPNRFGWIVEYDPYDPAAMPKKHTGIGRFKHEGATCLINKDGRLVRVHRRRRALRLSLQIRLEAGPTTRPPAPPTARCWTTARSMSPSSTRTSSPGCRWSMARVR